MKNFAEQYEQPEELQKSFLRLEIQSALAKKYPIQKIIPSSKNTIDGFVPELLSDETFADMMRG